MAATSQQVHQTLESYVRAWATNDRALFLSLFSEDARWADPVGMPEFRGHEGVARFWDFAHQDPERTLHPRLEEIRACGREGILRFTMQVRIPSRNQGLDLSVIDYFVLDDAGKIQIARAFWGESNAMTPSGMTAIVPDVSQAYEA